MATQQNIGNNPGEIGKEGSSNGTVYYTQAQVDEMVKNQAQTLAQTIVAQQMQNALIAQQLGNSGKTMTRFAVGDYVTNVKTKISSPLWNNSSGSISEIFKSYLQPTSSRQYHINVYNDDPSLLPDIQFAIAYGDYYGSGSLNTYGDSPSRAVYFQYKNILISDAKSQFQLASEKKLNSIYVLSIARNQLKDKLDPGNWQLVVKGSGKTVQLMDDSNSTTVSAVNEAGRVFNIISGSITDGVGTPYNVSGSYEYYGLVYPDLGIMIFDADALAGSASFAITKSVVLPDVLTKDSWSFNVNSFFNAISGAMVENPTYNAFVARNEEFLNSSHYFVRVKNNEYNYTNNPTFISGSSGKLLYDDFIDNPNVYITTVGLYNDNNELLAVAKLSRPLLKNFDLESLLRIRLDF